VTGLGFLCLMTTDRQSKQLLRRDRACFFRSAKTSRMIPDCTIGEIDDDRSDRSDIVQGGPTMERRHPGPKDAIENEVEFFPRPAPQIAAAIKFGDERVKKAFSGRRPSLGYGEGIDLPPNRFCKVSHGHEKLLIG